MFDLLTTGEPISISNVGCGLTRCMLLGLEPGSRIWFEVEGEKLLFERAQDDASGRVVRTLHPVGESAAAWERIRREVGCFVIEVELTERPCDAGRSAAKWADDDIPGALPAIAE